MSSYSRNRDFLFCHLCGTMLEFPSLDYSECPLCHTRKDLKDVLGKEISYTISREEIRRELGMCQIEDTEVQVKLPKVSKICEKCGHGEATYYTKQTRSADEGQITFYTCDNASCGHQFQES